MLGDQVRTLALQTTEVEKPHMMTNMYIPKYTPHQQTAPPISHVDKIRIPELHLQANSHNGETVWVKTHSLDDTIRILCRITNRCNGMCKHCAIRLVQAYMITCISYVALHLKWLGSEKKNKIECMIRRGQSVFQSMRVPTSF